MPSNALTTWQNDRLLRLNAVDAQCHALHAAGPANSADELLRGYVMLLSAHLQGYCRELYSECLQHVSAGAPIPMIGTVQAMGSAELQINRANPKWASIRADFGRFGFDLRAALLAAATAPGGLGLAGHNERVQHVSHLNKWRNYAAHHLTNVPAGGPFVPATVTAWKDSCDSVATELDAVMYNRVMTLTGVAPW
jgi:hypothetical protein